MRVYIFAILCIISVLLEKIISLKLMNRYLNWKSDLVSENYNAKTIKDKNAFKTETENSAEKERSTNKDIYQVETTNTKILSEEEVI